MLSNLPSCGKVSKKACLISTTYTRSEGHKKATLVLSVIRLSKCYHREDSHDAQDSRSDWFVTSSWEGQENQECCCCHDHLKRDRARARVICHNNHQNVMRSHSCSSEQIPLFWLLFYYTWTHSMVVCKMLYQAFFLTLEPKLRSV